MRPLWNSVFIRFLVVLVRVEVAGGGADFRLCSELEMWAEKRSIQSRDT